jgi:hypothetical protein
MVQASNTALGKDKLKRKGLHVRMEVWEVFAGDRLVIIIE